MKAHTLVLTLWHPCTNCPQLKGFVSNDATTIDLEHIFYIIWCSWVDLKTWLICWLHEQCIGLINYCATFLVRYFEHFHYIWEIIQHTLRYDFRLHEWTIIAIFSTICKINFAIVLQYFVKRDMMNNTQSGNKTWGMITRSEYLSTHFQLSLPVHGCWYFMWTMTYDIIW